MTSPGGLQEFEWASDANSLLNPTMHVGIGLPSRSCESSPSIELVTADDATTTSSPRAQALERRVGS
jgi:hypothetical protein